jgi:hypothetical protein
MYLLLYRRAPVEMHVSKAASGHRRADLPSWQNQGQTIC